eukprot:g81485.t1
MECGRIITFLAIFSSFLFILHPLISLTFVVFGVHLQPRHVVMPFLEILYVAFFYIAVTWVATKNRVLQPLKSRNCRMLFISILSGATLRLWLMVARSPHFAFSDAFCDVTRWIVNVCYPGLTLPYLLRAIQLHRVFALRAPAP